MSTFLMLIGIGLMVQSILPAPAALVGFIVWCIGIVVYIIPLVPRQSNN